MTTTSQAAPGWYPDPSDPRQLRWYDGAQWTQNVHAAAPTPQPTYQTPAQPTYQTPAQSTYQAATGQFGYQAPASAQPQEATQPYGGQLPGNGCQVCGAVPAMKVHLRGHQGMLLIMRWLTYRGQFCRDCGTAQFRDVQRATMLAGWWGYFSFVANTYNVFHNMNVERGLRALGAPQGRVRAAKPMPETVFKSPGFAVTLCLPVILYLLVTQVWS